MDGFQEIAAHYELGLEDGRTMELVERFLAPPPQRILDIHGGTGIYAAQLANAGYQVHLIDLIERHINEATARVDCSLPTPSRLLSGTRVTSRRKTSPMT
jgi:2-polyprenyl-3-methyl-5-hydroxy-6-metoxy-1,4-benzoquinol methylase